MPLWFIIAICFLPLLLFLGWTRRFREKNPEIFGYILSLVGTFVGIIVGLYFNDLASAKDKRARTVKVLEASKEEMEWLMNRAKLIDVVTDTVADGKRQKYYFLEMPPFYSETLRSELLAETLHPNSLEQFNLIREILLFNVEVLRGDIKTNDTSMLKKDLADYRSQLKSSIDAIDLEIKRLDEQLSEGDFVQQSRQSIRKLMDQ